MSIEICGNPRHQLLHWHIISSQVQYVEMTYQLLHWHKISCLLKYMEMTSSVTTLTYNIKSIEIYGNARHQLLHWHMISFQLQYVEIYVISYYTDIYYQVKWNMWKSTSSFTTLTYNIMSIEICGNQRHQLLYWHIIWSQLKYVKMTYQLLHWHIISCQLKYVKIHVISYYTEI